MITAQSTTELEVTVEPTKTRYLSVRCTGTVLVTMIGVDPGDGFRPFSPLLAKFDGVERTLPVSLDAGSHSVELLGEAFNGSGLLMVGYGLHEVSGVSIGGAEAEVAAQVAAVPGYYEGDGKPEDVAALLSGAINGARYKDRLNKIRYELSEGTWIQLAS